MKWGLLLCSCLCARYVTVNLGFDIAANLAVPDKLFSQAHNSEIVYKYQFCRWTGWRIAQILGASITHSCIPAVRWKSRF